jgi:hypothetical protein
LESKNKDSRYEMMERRHRRRKRLKAEEGRRKEEYQ